MSRLPATLPFEQSHVPANFAEYWWGIRFDTDRNASTGYQGYDVEIALIHVKRAGDPFEASPIEATQHQVIEWIESAGSVRGYVRHNDVVARIDPADPNTLLLAVPRAWPEISRIDELDEFALRTIYYAPTPGSASDLSPVGLGTHPVTDPAGDVDHEFVDIVGGGWNTRPWTGLLLANRPQGVVPRNERPGDRPAREAPHWSGGTWVAGW